MKNYGQIIENEDLVTKEYVDNAVANVAGSGGNGGVIDVLELPTESIDTAVFYRLMTAKFVSNLYYAVDGWTCYCVDGLPDVGESVSTDMVNITGYYNTQDNEVYGYADSTISAAGGVPVGWYPIGVLGQAFDVNWGGVITDESEIDDTAKVLLSKEFYIYQDGWCKLPFACEKAPEINIQWDGDMTDRIVLDMSLLGYDQGVYFVKISDEVFTTTELIGWGLKLQYNDGSYADDDITAGAINTTTYPGAFIVGDYVVVVYDANALAAALGIPASIYTEGVYFWKYTEGGYVSNLTSPSKVTKIDEKFLPDVNVETLGLHPVAISGNYNDLYNQPNLSNYVTSSQLSNYVTSSQVDSKIAAAIGAAIGGSY